MNDKPLISIVMPCYNCATTLREAFDSIYRQNFSYLFEVVLVDDGSTDGTAEIINDLIENKPECHFIRHDRNKGGGAARNTAIKASRGEIIFCLDGDDILADNSLPPMINYLKKEEVDGVIFKHRRFFKDDVKKYREESNPDISREIALSDLFESPEKRIILNNFVHTKKAYEVTGGYPEDHGFDTPEFEFKFLAKQLRLKICPNSIYYHRQAAKHKSYFEREYEKGFFSIYIYLAIEPALEFFTDEVIDLCVQFDIFKQNELKNENNLLGAIMQQFRKDGTIIFQGTERSLRSKTFTDSIYDIRSERYSEALEKLEICKELYGEETATLLFNKTRCEKGLSGVEKKEVISQTLQWSQNCGILKARKMRRLPLFMVKFYLLCKTLFLKK